MAFRYSGLGPYSFTFLKNENRLAHSQDFVQEGSTWRGPKVTLPKTENSSDFWFLGHPWGPTSRKKCPVFYIFPAKLYNNVLSYFRNEVAEIRGENWNWVGGSWKVRGLRIVCPPLQISGCAPVRLAKKLSKRSKTGNIAKLIDFDLFWSKRGSKVVRFQFWV